MRMKRTNEGKGGWTTRVRCFFQGTLCRTIPALFLIAMGSAFADDGKDNPLERNDIKVSHGEIDNMILDIQGALSSAESALKDVEDMKIGEADFKADELFEEMKSKVTTMLDRLGPNSVLMDNLEGAKANVIVFKRWYERQPADYPDRDSQIVSLEEVLKEYDELRAQIDTGRQEAQIALSLLVEAQFVATMAERVDSVKQSIERTRRVLESLKKLGDGIRKVAEQDVPGSIPG